MTKFIALAALPFAWPTVIFSIYTHKMMRLYASRTPLDWVKFYVVGTVLVFIQFCWFDFLLAGIL